MSVLLVKQILTAYYLPLEGSEEDIVAQHRHMIHMEAVITAVSSHRNTWSDKTAGQIRSLSALRSPPHTSVIWGEDAGENIWYLSPSHYWFCLFFHRSIQNANWWITVISLICHAARSSYPVSCSSVWHIYCSLSILLMLHLWHYWRYVIVGQMADYTNPHYSSWCGWDLDHINCVFHFFVALTVWNEFSLSVSI